jgi:hypothetical protein
MLLSLCLWIQVAQLTLTGVAVAAAGTVRTGPANAAPALTLNAAAKPGERGPHGT